MTENKKHIDRMVRRTLMRYALTFTFLELTEALTQLTSGILISRYLGETAMAAHGLFMPLFCFAGIFFGILFIGVQDACAQEMSRGAGSHVGKIVSTALQMAAVFGLFLLLFGEIGGGTLSRLLGAAGESGYIFPDLRDFIRGWFWGAPGAAFAFALSGLVILDGNRKCMALAHLVQIGFNGAATLLAVTLLQGGMYGAGVAGALSYYVTDLILLTNFLFGKTMFPLKLTRLGWEWKLLWEVVEHGLPKVTHQICKVAAPMALNYIAIAVGGRVAITALSVQHNLNEFVFVLGLGIGESTRLLGKFLFNEKDAPALRLMAKNTVALLLLWAGSSSLLVILFAPTIAGLYLSPTSAVLPTAVVSLRFYGLYVFFVSCNNVILGWLHGAGRSVEVHVHTLGCEFVWRVVCALVLSHFFGLKGLWASWPVAEALSMGAYVLLVLLRNKPAGKKGLKETLLFLPNLENTQSLDITVKSMEDVTQVSQRANQFCQAQGVEKRRAYYTALCIEELTNNIVTHGFADGKNHTCSLRLLVEEEGGITLRIRDDCPLFDLGERYQSLKEREDDPTANIGIRLVYGIAKDVSYINVLDTNTLMIQV